MEITRKPAGGTTIKLYIYIYIIKNNTRLLSDRCPKRRMLPTAPLPEKSFEFNPLNTKRETCAVYIYMIFMCVFHYTYRALRSHTDSEKFNRRLFTTTRIRSTRFAGSIFSDTVYTIYCIMVLYTIQYHNNNNNNLLKYFYFT